MGELEDREHLQGIRQRVAKLLAWLLTQLIRAPFYYFIHFEAFVHAYRRELSKAETESVAKLEELKYIDAETAARIEPALKDIIRCYNVRRSWHFAWKAVKSQPQAPIIWALILLGGTLFFRWPLPRLDLNQGMTLGPVLLLVIIAFVAHSRLQYRNLVAIRVGELAVLLVSTISIHHWHPDRHSSWYSISFHPSTQVGKWIDPQFPTRVQVIDVQPTLYSMCWILTAVSVVIVGLAGIRGLIMLVFNPYDSWHPRSSYYSSVLVVGMLDLAGSLDTSLSGNEERDDSVLHGRREWFSAELKRLALIASGPWARYMNSQYGSVGRHIASHGNGIAHTLRSWQFRSAFIGNDTRHLCEDMTAGLVRAIEGKWEELAAKEIGEVRPLKARLYKAIKRMVAIVVPIGVAFSLWARILHIPASYVQPLVLICLTFSALQLLIAIDPEASGRLDASAKLTEMFRRH